MRRPALRVSLRDWIALISTGRLPVDFLVPSLSMAMLSRVLKLDLKNRRWTMLPKPCQVLFETIFDRQNKKQLLTFSRCFVPLFNNVSVYKVGFTPYVKMLYGACEKNFSSKSAFFQKIKNTKNYFRLFVRFFYKMHFFSVRHLPLIITETPFRALLFVFVSILSRNCLLAFYAPFL